MRTTVRLDEQLLREVRLAAARTGRTMTAVIEDALRESLNRPAARTETSRVRLPTVRGRGLHVDLDDSAALLDRMEGR